MIAFLLVLLSACLPAQLVVHRTPADVDPLPTPTLPVGVEYEVLGPATAKVCADTAELGYTSGAAAFGTAPTLYNAARYAAIESVPGADNLMYVRVKTEMEGIKECVTVTGRAYRVARMTSARPAPAGP